MSTSFMSQLRAHATKLVTKVAVCCRKTPPCMSIIGIVGIGANSDAHNNNIQNETPTQVLLAETPRSQQEQVSNNIDRSDQQKLVACTSTPPSKATAGGAKHQTEGCMHGSESLSGWPHPTPCLPCR